MPSGQFFWHTWLGLNIFCLHNCLNDSTICWLILVHTDTVASQMLQIHPMALHDAAPPIRHLPNLPHPRPDVLWRPFESSKLITACHVKYSSLK